MDVKRCPGMDKDRRSLGVAKSPHARDDQDFIDAGSDCGRGEARRDLDRCRGKDYA